MSDPAALHPLAPEHLPFFIPLADGTDQMMQTATWFILIFAFLAGVFYLYLHSLPERMAHGRGRTQFQIVAILALLALFTHESIFWIAALLLAAATLPDYLTPITSGARSLAKLAGRNYDDDRPSEEDAPPERPSDSPSQSQSQSQSQGRRRRGQGEPARAGEG